MSKASSNRKRRNKRRKREKRRFDRLVRHVTICSGRRLTYGLWSNDADGVHVTCRECSLKFWRHIESNEIEIKGVGRISADATVLDLMSL